METFDQFVPPSSSDEEEEEVEPPHLRLPSHSAEDIKLASSQPKKPSGRIVFKETRHPVYRGVRSRNKDKWVCELRDPNNKSRIWLGTYPKAEMAARAHDVAAIALRGRSACLNFADSAWRVRVPDSKDHGEIQRAAAEAAKELGGSDGGAATGSSRGGSEGVPMMPPPPTETLPTWWEGSNGDEEEEEGSFWRWSSNSSSSNYR
ncbi:hypothetical protein MLD38_027802 [Melastoma candidum]|uniref:Uncharacterized protein n=1 Tax=Melastoma candidum TaxID=119954 RepID=A0ACB9P2Q5_9MYRT|nr:hypothetical protein MLD38_027802 [Melastoma candidum]